MANSDKNILVTPNKNQSGLPEISFTGFANTTTTLKIKDGTPGTLEFESNGVPLFTLNSNLTSGTLFSLNGSGALPYIDVSSDGTVTLTPEKGCVDVTEGGVELPSYESSAYPQSAVEGLMIFDNTEKVPKIFDGSNWVTLGKSIVKKGLNFWVDISRRDCYDPYNNSTQVKDLVTGEIGSFNSSPTFDYRNGGSLVFDGVDDFVQWTNQDRQQRGTTNLTVCLWCYPTAIAYPNPPGGRSRGSAWGGYGNGYLGIIESVDGNIGSALHWALSSTSGRPSTWAGSILPNKWVHLAGVYNGVESLGYIDGVLCASAGAMTGALIKNPTIWMGTYGGLSDSNHNFPGRISEIQMYDRGLTQGEIWQNYNATRGRYGE